MIKIGNSLIGSGKITIGGTTVQRVFVGNDLVYDSAPSGNSGLYIDNAYYPFTPASGIEDLIVKNYSFNTWYIYIAAKYTGWDQPAIPVPTYSATTIGETTPQKVFLNQSYSTATYNFSGAYYGYNDYIEVLPGTEKTIRITKNGGDENNWSLYLGYSTTPIISPPADDSRISVWTTAIGSLEPRCYLVLNNGNYPYVGGDPTEVTIFNPTNSKVDIYGAAKLTAYNSYGVEIMYESSGGLVTFRIYSNQYVYNQAGYVDANSSKVFYIGCDDLVNSDTLTSYFSDSSNGSFLYI